MCVERNRKIKRRREREKKERGGGGVRTEGKREIGTHREIDTYTHRHTREKERTNFDAVLISSAGFLQPSHEKLLHPSPLQLGMLHDPVQQLKSHCGQGFKPQFGVLQPGVWQLKLLQLGSQQLGSLGVHGLIWQFGNVHGLSCFSVSRLMACTCVWDNGVCVCGGV